MRTLAAVAALALAAACPKEDGPTPPPVPPPAAPGTGASSQPATTGAIEPESEAEKHASAASRETVDPDGVVRRGDRLSPGLEATPVSVAKTKAKELDGKVVKLTGKVESVCQPMGCWFVVEGDKPEDRVRITSKAHNIFVPKAAAGMQATVEGTLKVKTLDQKTAQHYEDERELKEGETRKTITGDVTELGIDVTALEMKKG